MLSMYVSCSTATSVLDCAWMGSSHSSFELTVDTEGFISSNPAHDGLCRDAERLQRFITMAFHGCV